MANGFEFDFKKAYGQDFDEMRRAEKDTAILSQLYYIRAEAKDALKISHTNEERLNKHSTYFKIVTFCGGALFIALISLVADILFRHGCG